MMALPAVLPDPAWGESRRLGRDHWVRVDSCDYSVHPRAIGRRINLRLDLEELVVPCAGDVVARHDRCWARNRTVTDPAHDDRGMADNSVGRIIKAILRAHLVLIDEIGFAPLDYTGAQLFFRLVAGAYERRSPGIGSHWPFDDLGRFLHEHTTAAWLLAVGEVLGVLPQRAYRQPFNCVARPPKPKAAQDVPDPSPHHVQGGVRACGESAVADPLGPLCLDPFHIVRGHPRPASAL